MTAEAAGVVLPDTVAGQRMAWLLTELGIGGWTGAAPASGAFVENGERTIGQLKGELDGCSVVSIGDSGDAAEVCVVVVQTSPMRRSALRVVVESEEPHRIRSAGALRILPEGMFLRPATAEDGAELAELCRQTPILLGDGGQLVIDPGENYWDATRLMEIANALVAVLGDRIVAVQLGTMFEARYGGKHMRVAIVLHTRVHPDFARSGVRTVIQRTMQQISAQRTQQAQAEAGVTAPDPGTSSDRVNRPRAHSASPGSPT